MIPALALIAIFGTAVTFFILRARAAAQVTWQVLPRGTRYQVPPGFDVQRLERALDMAVGGLSTIWPRPEVERVIAGAEVVVMREESWIDGFGRTIGADSFGSHIRVGNTLSALFHEFSHSCDRLISHVVDETHAGWPARGISAADSAYRAWVKTQ